MKKCERCDLFNVYFDEDIFCPKHGTPLVKAKDNYCPNCQELLLLHYKYCKKCGASVVEEAIK